MPVTRLNCANTMSSVPSTAVAFGAVTTHPLFSHTVPPITNTNVPPPISFCVPAASLSASVERVNSVPAVLYTNIPLPTASAPVASLIKTRLLFASVTPSITPPVSVHLSSLVMYVRFAISLGNGVPEMSPSMFVVIVFVAATTASLGSSPCATLST